MSKFGLGARSLGTQSKVNSDTSALHTGVEVSGVSKTARYWPLKRKEGRNADVLRFWRRLSIQWSRELGVNIGVENSSVRESITNVDGIGGFLDLVIVVVKHLPEKFLAKNHQPFLYMSTEPFLITEDSQDSAADDTHLFDTTNSQFRATCSRILHVNMLAHRVLHSNLPRHLLPVLNSC